MGSGSRPGKVVVVGRQSASNDAAANGASATRTGPSTLSILVAGAAERDASAVALVGLTSTLTFGDFAARVDATARQLVAAGLEAGDRVGVSFHKDVDAYVAVHAVLRAGGVVVPIDPMGPPATLSRIARDVEVRGLLLGVLAARRFDATLDEIASLLPAFGTVSDGDAAVTLPEVAPDDVAYIIFTSGSTGTPKGIVHTHRSALAYATRAAGHLRSDDRVGGMSPFHFDMSTLELYAAPLAGAAVVVMSEAHTRLPASLTERSHAEDVSLWYTVPSLLAQVLDRGNLDENPLSSLRSLWFAGEVMPPGVLDALRARLPHAEFVNVYGPAEVNECTRWTVPTDHPSEQPCPVGSPWEGVDLRVVDDDDRDVAPGERGELWVSAPTVMTGYWGRTPTDSNLIERDGGRPPWYRTGDVVAARPDGVIDFHGRRDHQVKVRGVRLELEAIEAVVTDAPGVQNAVAVVSPDGDRIDVVAVAAASGVDGGDAAPDLAALRRWCATRLPPVAVPASITFAPDLPTTPTGKIDRAAVRKWHANDRSTVLSPAPSGPPPSGSS